MARIVLVHGAFQGAWCWDEIVPRLLARGHRVEAIDLPGSGEDPTPVTDVTLDSYQDRIVAQLRADPEPAVLVGHSMGGMAVTAAASAAPESVRKLVYIAAFLPSDGESLFSLTHKPEGAGNAVQANMVVQGTPPVATMPPAAAVEAAFAQTPMAMLEKYAGRARPQALAPFAAPVHVDESVQPPRNYIFTLRDRSIPIALQRRMVHDNPCAEVAELDTDHSPFFSRPSELTDLLHHFADV